MRTFMVTALLFLGSMGCDPGQANLDALEEHLKSEPARAGKVGQIVALGVRQRARTLGTISSPDLSCQIPLAWRRTRITTAISAADVEQAVWTEERHYDASSGVLISEMNQGSRPVFSQIWRVEQDHTFVSDPLSNRWFKHPWTSEDEHWMKTNGLTAGQVVLDAVGGWRSTEPGQWVHGQLPLLCEPGRVSENWLDRFAGRVTLVDASMSVHHGRREIQGRWRRSDGGQIRVVVEEWSELFPIPEIGTSIELKPALSFDEKRDAWEKRGLISR